MVGLCSASAGDVEVYPNDEPMVLRALERRAEDWGLRALQQDEVVRMNVGDIQRDQLS